MPSTLNKNEGMQGTKTLVGTKHNHVDADVSHLENNPKKRKRRVVELYRTMKYQSKKDMNLFRNCPWQASMNLNFVTAYWQKFSNTNIFHGVLALLQGFLDIVFEWRFEETKYLKLAKCKQIPDGSFFSITVNG